MRSRLCLSENILIGTPAVLPCPSPSTTFAVVSEGDANSEVLYDLDRSRTRQPIVDDLLVYEVDDIENREHSALIEVFWSGGRAQGRAVR
jgi:hypothetical protein